VAAKTATGKQAIHKTAVKTAVGALRVVVESPIRRRAAGVVVPRSSGNVDGISVPLGYPQTDRSSRLCAVIA